MNTKNAELNGHIRIIHEKLKFSLNLEDHEKSWKWHYLCISLSMIPTYQAWNSSFTQNTQKVQYISYVKGFPAEINPSNADLVYIYVKSLI